MIKFQEELTTESRGTYISQSLEPGFNKVYIKDFTIFTSPAKGSRLINFLCQGDKVEGLDNSNFAQYLLGDMVMKTPIDQDAPINKISFGTWETESNKGDMFINIIANNLLKLISKVGKEEVDKFKASCANVQDVESLLKAGIEILKDNPIWVNTKAGVYAIKDGYDKFSLSFKDFKYTSPDESDTFRIIESYSLEEVISVNKDNKDSQTLTVKYGTKTATKKWEKSNKYDYEYAEGLAPASGPSSDGIPDMPVTDEIPLGDELPF